MADDRIVKIELHGAGLEAAVEADRDRACLRVSADPSFADAAALGYEVLVQPVDDEGVPVCGAVTIASGRVPLEPFGSDGGSIGFAWLPASVTPEIAKRCYLRLHRAA